MNFNFGEVLSRAWQIIWKHKILWVFGILASCTRGNGGGSGGGGGGGGDSGYNNGQPPFAGDDLSRYMVQLGQWLEDNVWIIIAIGVAIILISLLFYFLGYVGKIALIKGTNHAETGAESLNFGELFTESLPYFWRIFGMHFLVGLAFLIILLPLILLGVLTMGVGFLCIIPLICILIPVMWAVMVVLEQASAAIVIEDLSMVDGVKRGWEVSKSNIGPVIIMALILLFGGGIASLIISLPILLAFIPIIPMLMTGNFESTTPLIIAGLCFVAYIPVIILLNGVLTAYIQSAWTLTYMRLTAPKDNAPVFVEANA